MNRSFSGSDPVMANSNLKDTPTLSCSTAEIVEAVFKHDRRVLLYGPPGVGKSTLSNQLGRALYNADRRCWCISADPGSPGFGVPGGISLGKWDKNAWRVTDYTALCTLDAGRFRLPLVSAVQQLVQPALDRIVVIDGPGVVRGVAGKELLEGLIAAARVDAILALTTVDRPPLLLDELLAMAPEVFFVHAATEAMRPGKRVRARRRTAQWDAYLADAAPQELDLSQVNLLGTPPPLGEASAWVGRQLAFLARNQTQTMGEVLHMRGDILTILLPAGTAITDTVLVRDALRTTAGLLETAEPFTAERLEYIPPADLVPCVNVSGGPRVVGRVGHVDVALLNGVFGDPLLHVRLRHQGRSLLFDLGDGRRLPTRIAHQVTDVFISHAHMDHISGFQWLLRSSFGARPPCRVYGPPGLAQHIVGFFHCFLWDRIGERGPVFEVAELHSDRLRRYRIRAGNPHCERLEEVTVRENVVYQEAGFRVRAVVLDHHTPVLAFAFEPNKEINVRKDRLSAQGLQPGPWLEDLKQQLMTKNPQAMISLPNGSTQPAGSLSDELVLIKPGKKLVYATDLADTADNRQRLVTLAQHAHTFFCEAPFIETHAEQGQRTGHLTARACGEIASAAGVARLVPFHFSRRYINNPQQLFDELSAACSCVILPKTMRLFEMSIENGAESEQIPITPDLADNIIL
jgi:ribonuclease BN (tRNA processing enzyme)/polynucleotide 5'-kinase involved in rRNA processing